MAHFPRELPLSLLLLLVGHFPCCAGESPKRLIKRRVWSIHNPEINLYTTSGWALLHHGILSAHKSRQENDVLDLCTNQGRQLKLTVCKTGDQGIIKSNTTLYDWQGVDDEVLLVPWGSNGRFCAQRIVNEMNIWHGQTVQLYLV